MEMQLEDGSELTIDDVHFRVELELDSQSEIISQRSGNYHGRSQSQKGDEKSGKRRVKCVLCGSEDHRARQCAKYKTKVCRDFNTSKGCKYSDSGCFYIHEQFSEEDVKAAESSVDSKVGVSASLRPTDPDQDIVPYHGTSKSGQLPQWMKDLPPGFHDDPTYPGVTNFTEEEAEKYWKERDATLGIKYGQSASHFGNVDIIDTMDL